MMLNRREFVTALLKDRGNLLVVTGLGSPTYDVAACGDHARNFYLWGAMGGAAMLGLGLALARPSERVAVITGDGEMLMGLSSLATIGVKRPPNLAIVVLDNGHYAETGMQASHTHYGVDLARVADACGFTTAFTLADMSGLGEARRLVYEGGGPVLVRARIAHTTPPRILPDRDGHAVRLRFMRAVGGM